MPAVTSGPIFQRAADARGRRAESLRISAHANLPVTRHLHFATPIVQHMLQPPLTNGLAQLNQSGARLEFKHCYHCYACC